MFHYPEYTLVPWTNINKSNVFSQSGYGSLLGLLNYIINNSHLRWFQQLQRYSVGLVTNFRVLRL